MTYKKFDNILGTICKPIFGGIGYIFMFHRVLPGAHSPIASGSSILEITPQYLENLVQQLNHMDIEFISMDEVPNRLKIKSKNSPFAVFTFDDGYVDNYVHVWPLLKKYRIPFTVYITTDLPDGKAILWWYLLEDLLVNGGKWTYRSKEDFVSFDLDDKTQASTASFFIRKILKFSESHRIPELCKSIFPNMDIMARTRSLSLNWDQIREMSSDQLVTIGAHSVSHASLPTLSKAEMEFEIRGSKLRIEEEIHKPVQHFAYPFGGPNAVTAREVAVVTKSDYCTAVTTYFANIFPNHVHHLFALPRLDLPQLKNPITIEIVLTGCIAARVHRLKRFITY